VPSRAAAPGERWGSWWVLSMNVALSIVTDVKPLDK